MPGSRSNATESGNARNGAMPFLKLGEGWFSLAALVLGTACGSGQGSGDDAAALDYVKPYATVCTQTVCQKQAQDCRAHEEQQCSDCFGSCSSPFQSDPALCASVCHDICSTSDCDGCSAPSDQCVSRGIRFEAPPLNPELRDLAARALHQCDPSLSAGENAEQVNFFARSIRHEYASTLECFLAKGCDAEACETVGVSGSVGSALCTRHQACSDACDESLGNYLNAIEPVLRPGLVAELARCSREADCDSFLSCWQALMPAVGLATYPSPT